MSIYSCLYESWAPARTRDRARKFRARSEIARPHCHNLVGDKQTAPLADGPGRYHTARMYTRKPQFANPDAECASSLRHKTKIDIGNHMHATLTYNCLQKQYHVLGRPRYGQPLMRGPRRSGKLCMPLAPHGGEALLKQKCGNLSFLRRGLQFLTECLQFADNIIAKTGDGVVWL